MRRFFFAFILLGHLASAFGQEGAIDSLNRVLSSRLPDTARVSTLLELSSQFYRTDAEEAKRLASEARLLAEKIHDKKGLGQAYKAIGLSYYFQNDWVEAVLNWKLALEAFTSINDLNGVSNMLNNLGAVNFNQGDDKAALDYYVESLRVAEANNDQKRTATALVNIATVYLTKRASKHLALKYYQRALPLSVALGDHDVIGTCAVNLGEIFLTEKELVGDISYYDPDSALYYFEMALDAYRSIPTGNVPYALKNIGRVYAARGEYTRAIQYQTEAYQIAMARDARLEMAQSLIDLGQTYEKKGDIRKAISSFQQARSLAEGINALYEMQAAYKGLADNYSKTNDHELAFLNFNLYSDIKDTLYNAEMDKKLHAHTLSYEIEKKEGQISLLEKDQELSALELEREKAIKNGTIVFVVLLLVLAGGLYNRYRYTKKTNSIITREKERSEELLLNILPAAVAEELKAKGTAEAVQIDQVSVLFTDFKGFTAMSEIVTPKQLVKDLHECFSAFDAICGKYGIEKIKTIGDAYMAAGGLPVPNTTHASDVINAALEMRDFIAEGKARKIAAGQPYFEIRIGIHTGPLVAGIVGVKKFSYDIWGDTVNTASRMESSGEVGRVNISEATYQAMTGSTTTVVGFEHAGRESGSVRPAELFTYTPRGKVKAKGKGEMEMFFVERSAASEAESSEQVRPLSEQV
jgi:adenylate cyclase